MAHPRLSLFNPMGEAAAQKPAAPVRLPQTVKNDVFLTAILETGNRKLPRRSPLEWAGAMALHIGIIATLIIVPLYTTGTIHFNEYETTPLIAPPPPPPAPPAPVAAAPAAPHTVRPNAKLTFKLQKVIQPIAVPKKISSDADSSAPPALAGLPGGLPGGVSGGEIGGGIGGVLGGTTALPPPPPAQPQPRPARKIVRVGSDLKAPRQTVNVNPEYPPLARQTHIWGVVLVDAIIDEQGNVVQARAISGHPLLIPAALKAVLQWKYEPTSLNGQPISVELQVQVHFNLNSNS